MLQSFLEIEYEMSQQCFRPVSAVVSSAFHEKIVKQFMSAPEGSTHRGMMFAKKMMGACHCTASASWWILRISHVRYALHRIKRVDVCRWSISKLRVYRGNQTLAKMPMPTQLASKQSHGRHYH